MMIQWDGSHHDWLEKRGPWLTLVGAIDDATGEFLPRAIFVEQECASPTPLGDLRPRKIRKRPAASRAFAPPSWACGHEP